MQSSASRLVAPVLLEVEVKQDEAVLEPLIPAGLWWIYLVAPPLFTATLDAKLLLGDLDTLLRSLVSTYIHTLAIAGSIHLVYLHLIPRLFGRIKNRAARFGVHALTVSILVPLGTIAVKPIIVMICRNRMDVREALIISYVIATLMLLAALSYQRLRKRAQEVERLAVAERHAALTAQLRALQSRTNPHFLFNSLNAVASLIPKDPVRAEQTVERLAEVLRYSLQRTRRGLVRLEEELDVVTEYLEIESVRFGERLTYRIDVDPRVKRFRIPPMALEPLVENAVLHGIGNRREGGTIHIEATLEREQIRLCVIDDGPGCGASEHSGTGTGLNDLRERLRLLYGHDDVLVLDRGPNGGCRATLMLPIMK